MSKRFGVPDFGDWATVIRHTVFPALAGVVVEAGNIIQAGGEVTAAGVKQAMITAVVAGVLRLLSRWVVPTQRPAK